MPIYFHLPVPSSWRLLNHYTGAKVEVVVRPAPSKLAFLHGSRVRWAVPKIVLQPGGILLEAPRKANLLHFLQEKGVSIGSACGGQGLCASCKVNVLKGQTQLSRPNDRELELAERNNLQKDERISCQTKVLGDIEITTSYWKEGFYE